MTKTTTDTNGLPAVNLVALKQQFKEALAININEFGLEENHAGEFISNFAGVHLSSTFQPIYHVENSDLYGHEAFLRPRLIATSQDSTPDFAFSYAEASGNLIKLDRISRALHLLNYKQIFQEKGLLFLNVHPHLLIGVNQHGKVFERILHAHSLPTERVVIELRDIITPEPNDSLLGYERKLASAIDNYHEHGYKIAIDNFGSSQSLVSRLWKLNPDFIKLDKQVIHDAEHQPKLRKSLQHLVNVIRAVGSEPIVTGIETQAQLDIATQAGVQLLQGYLLGKPVSVNSLKNSEVIHRPSKGLIVQSA